MSISDKIPSSTQFSDAENDKIYWRSEMALLLQPVDSSLISFWPRRPRGRRSPPGKPGPCSLGYLEVFPYEILELILKNINFRTLGEVRLVNKKGKYMVDTLREFKHVMDFAPGIVHALTLTHTVPFFSAEHLYTLLYDEKCKTCGEFGPYLFLLLGWRCCRFCLVHHPRYRVLSLPEARREFGIEKWQIYGRYPILEPIWGEYHDPPTFLRPRDRYVGGGPGSMEIVSIQHLRSLVYGTPEDGISQMMICEQSASYRQIISGISRRQPPFRGMAAISFPYLNPKTNVLEHGVRCKGCSTQVLLGISALPWTIEYERAIKEILFSRARTFSEAGFASHSNECYMLEKIWRSGVNKHRALTWNEVGSSEIEEGY